MTDIRILPQHTSVLHAEFIRYTNQTLQYHLQFLILAHHTRIFTRKELHQATHQVLIAATDGIEIEELTNAVQHILLFQIADLFLTRRSKLAIEGIHRLVTDDGTTRQRLAEYHTFQSLATAQRHVGLTMGKAMGSIDDGMLKGKTLTLMNGNRPRQSERILAEPSFHALLNLLGFLIQSIFRIGPLHLLQFKILVGILAAHGNLVADDGAHLANHTIIETVLRIVLDKHHLRSRFQDELEISRIR